jgi:hypothetical protein
VIFKIGNTTFNDGGVLHVRAFTPGASDLVTTDAQRAQQDGVIVGRDYIGSATWAFTIDTKAGGEAGAAAADAALHAEWNNPAIRTNPNTTVPLSYQMAGRWRRVYGRPGKYAGINGDTLTRFGRGRIVCDFRVTEPYHYDDTETSVVLTIVPGTTGGLTAPLASPLSTVRSSAPRAGNVLNAGDAATPLKVTFHGPVTNPWVRSATGMEVALIGTLAYDQSVTINPRAGTVTRQDGTNAAGMLTRATRMSTTLLQPGTTVLSFGGTDPTGTATATLSWRNAYTSI